MELEQFGTIRGLARTRVVPEVDATKEPQVNLCSASCSARSAYH